VMRKHRLAERLLIDVIGLDWEKVHDEACRWEHVISEDVERKLVDLLHAPTESPYGNPIPGLEELGVTEAAAPFRLGNEQLQDAVKNQAAPIQVVIERMSEEIQKDVEMMGTLRLAGIQPGAEVSAEAGGLGVRLSAVGSPSCEIDRLASTHLFVSRA
jgi:DtxR family Mn-dependent transcriptional regulator